MRNKLFKIAAVAMMSTSLWYFAVSRDGVPIGTQGGFLNSAQCTANAEAVLALPGWEQVVAVCINDTNPKVGQLTVGPVI